ncbi:MAG: hypothetical protein LQ341_002138 [Variospora aurantia]|nr:MAG: hypothetical protein LQ341_002138 [Variospora aurantia]
MSPPYVNKRWNDRHRGFAASAGSGKNRQYPYAIQFARSRDQLSKYHLSSTTTLQTEHQPQNLIGLLKTPFSRCLTTLE